MVTPGVPPIPHVGGPIIGPGAPTVLICNMPAAVMGDMCTCVGPPSTIVLGSMGVLIMNKPAARMGDLCAHGGSIVMGAPTVLIGEMSPGAGGAPVMAGMMGAIGKSLGAVIESLAGGLDAQTMGDMAKAMAAGAAAGTTAGILGPLSTMMSKAMDGMLKGMEAEQPGLLGPGVMDMGAMITGLTNGMNQAAANGEPYVKAGGRDEAPVVPEDPGNEGKSQAAAPALEEPEEPIDPVFVPAGPLVQMGEGPGNKPFISAVEGDRERAGHLARGNVGEILAADALATAGHTILSMKSDMDGTNQGGIDIITLKDGVVHFVDNKALTRAGNVSSVSALTTNFEKNQEAAREELIAAQKRATTYEEKAMYQSAINAIDSGKVKKVVTNANLARDGQYTSDVTDALKEKGVEFMDLTKPATS